MRMSRRELFALGIGGAVGLAAGSAAPAGAASVWSAAPFRRPWWVREVERPTVGIDDSTYGRYDSINNVFGSFRRYVGAERAAELQQLSRRRTRRLFE